jgi:predicted lactoylglutathione lyase
MPTQLLVNVPVTGLERATAFYVAARREPRPAQDLGFIYSRALADPDSHTWEPMWMDPTFVQPTE